VVAGDHLHLDAGGAAVGDGADRFVARRVGQAQHCQQGEAAVLDVGEVERGLGVAASHCQCQQAHPLGGDLSHPRMPEIGIERAVAIRAALAGAQCQHPLRRALEVDEAAPIMVVVEGRHESMLGLERDDIGAGQGLAGLARVQAGLQRQGQQRAFGRVA
jgi:hypothetical protein